MSITLCLFNSLLWKTAIYSWFTYYTRWLSIAMLVYQVTRQYQQESLPKGLWNMNQVDLVGGISPFHYSLSGGDDRDVWYVVNKHRKYEYAMMVQWSLLIPIPKKLVNLDHRSGWHRKTTSETIAGTKNHTTSKSTRSFEDFEGNCQPII